MKMKNILYSVALSVSSLLGACVDDPGNYDYQDVKTMFPIKIEGLKDTVLTILSEVQLKPVVTGLGEDREYEYVWYAYPTATEGNLPKRDTLGRTKDLTFVMTYPSGVKYSLVYQIKDKTTGYVITEKCNISGKSEFSTGWYILKDENEQTDMDYISFAGKQNNDILFKATGEKMKGRAIKVIYQASRYYHQVVNDDGTVTLKANLKAFHLISSEDARVLNPEDISVYKRYADMFYTAPAKPRSQNVYLANKDLFLLDDGLLRSITGMSSNVGKYGYQKLNGEDLDSEGLYCLMGGSSFLAYSHKTKSFLYLPIYGTQFQNFGNPDPAGRLTVSTTQMNAELLKLIPRNIPILGNETTGWALMKSIEGPQEYYLADIAFSGLKYPFADFDTITPTREFLDADVYGNHFLNTFYFAKGNVLSYYQKNDSDENSVEKIDIWPHFGANETISYIAQMKSEARVDNPWNYLVVLTNSPEGWRMYRFTLLGDGVNPMIDQLVEPVYCGEGNARYVMFRQ